MKNVMARGTLYVLISSLFFMVSGFIIHFGLGRILGPELYGTLGVILSLVGLPQIFLQNGVPQAVSKYVSEGQNSNAVKKEGLLIQSILSFAIFFFFIIFAPFLSSLLGDSKLTNYIRISAFIIPFCGISSIYTSILNGLRKFEHQALILTSYSIFRLFIIFLFLFLGFGVSGVIIGYAIPWILTTIISRHYSRNEKKDGTFSRIKLFEFSLPIIIFTLAYTAVMSLDLLFLKALIKDPTMIGYYASSSTLSRIPFYIFIGLSLTLLPSISKSLSTNNLEQAKSYVEYSTRYLMILLIPLIFILSATSEKLIETTYSSTYLPAGTSLSILIFGIAFLTLFVIFSNTIIGYGKPNICMVIAILMVPIDIILNYIFIPLYQLNGAAIATTITAFLGMAAAGLYISMNLGRLMRASSLSKIIISSMIIYIIAIEFQISGILLIIWYLILFILYFAILWMLKEIKDEDVEIAKNMIPGF